jgi:hypothetical protein
MNKRYLDYNLSKNTRGTVKFGFESSQCKTLFFVKNILIG